MSQCVDRFWLGEVPQNSRVISRGTGQNIPTAFKLKITFLEIAFTTKASSLISVVYTLQDDSKISQELHQSVLPLNFLISSIKWTDIFCHIHEAFYPELVSGSSHNVAGLLALCFLARFALNKYILQNTTMPLLARD